MTPTAPTIPMTTARQRLAVVWFIAAAMAVALMIVQTANGKYGSKASLAWGWLLPTIVPILSLVLSTLAKHASSPAQFTEHVDAFAYRTALGVSVFYVLALLATLFAQPFVGGSALDWMQTSNLFLGPLQGLTVVMVGAFFQKASGERKS